jgi:hypothetical protein
MRRELRKLLTSKHRSERIRGWSKLADELKASHRVLSREDVRQLVEFLRNEEDDDVHRLAGDTMWGLVCDAWGEHEARGGGGTPIPGRDRSLHGWVLHDFHRTSALLRSSGPRYDRRDAEAVENLARRFSFDGFPLTQFHSLPVGEEGWREFTTQEAPDAICVVGRIGLLGPQAVAVLENRQARFRFLQQEPPSSYERDDELKEYYVIEEYDGDRVLNEYRKDDVQGFRMDYGIVQRYKKFVGTRTMTVLLCAGCSSLGTMGAARWLARDLGLPQDPVTKEPILRPTTIGPQSQMEALIRTVSVANSSIWRPSRIELVGLYVDGCQWSPSDLDWHDRARHVVEIRLRHGQPISLRIDGVEASLRPKSQNFRLATAIVLEAGKSEEGTVDFELLARDKSIWEGRELPASRVRQRVHTLNSHVMRGILTIERGVSLGAQVIISDESRPVLPE